MLTFEIKLKLWIGQMSFLGAKKGCGLGKKIWGEDFQKGLKSVLDILKIAL